MADQDKMTEQDEMIRARRRQRIEEARRRKRRNKMLKKLAQRFAMPAACVLLGCVLLFVGIRLFGGKTQGKGADSPASLAGNMDGQEEAGGQDTTDGQDRADGQENQSWPGNQNGPGNQSGQGGQDSQLAETDPGTTTGSEEESAASNASTGQNGRIYTAQFTSATSQPGEDVVSPHALLIDLETGEVLVQRDAQVRINPASMTKILTVLVAAEHVENLDDTFTITLNETDYSYVNDCSTAGFAENETVTVRDLFYGTILPSGGEAAAGLAAYAAGTREAFVELMNEKLKELGLSDTAHFTNCVGLYDEEHYCTLYDMAMILEAALDNEICREVLSAHTYNTSATEQHPEGLLLSNWFLRRIEDKDTGGEVMCAKTGYVAQSGNCAASYGIEEDGRGYVCVTAGAGSAWRCIYDHVALYKEYTQ